MSWFYAKQGNVHDHGRVSYADLQTMVAAGRLSPHDVLWDESGDKGWVRARTIDGLFPEPAAVQSSPEQDVTPADTTTARPRRSLLFVVLVLVILFAAAGVAVWTRLPPRMPSEPAAPASVDPEVAAQTAARRLARERAARAERAEQLVGLVTASLQRKDTETARTQLAEMVELVGTNEVAAELTVSIADLEEALDTLAGHNQELLAGTLTRADADAFVSLSTQHDEVAGITNTVAHLLASPDLSAAQCLAIMRVAQAMSDTNQIKTVALVCSASLDEDFSSASCLDAVAICSEAKLPEEAMSLLVAFLERDETAWAVWLERAAMEAQSGQAKQALRSLKAATDSGDAGIKAKARADTRFDPIRDTWTFRRCVK